MKNSKLLLIGTLIVILVGIAGIVIFLQQSDLGEVQITLHSDPFPMTVGPDDLIVSLTDSRGRPIEGADVYAITQRKDFGSIPYTDSAKLYEDGQYYIPIRWDAMGQASIKIRAELPNGEMLSEEYVTFVYLTQFYDVENQAYRSEREIEEELANIPDDEYWIVVPQGAQEITGMYFEEFVPSRIELSVRGKNTLVIRNDDYVDNTIGPFFVGAGETFRQRFDEPGVFEGTCTINQGFIQIIVGP